MCQSQIQLNYTLICFTNQPLWKTQSLAGHRPMARATLHGHLHCPMHKAWRGCAARGGHCSQSVMLRSSLALVPMHVTPKITLGNKSTHTSNTQQPQLLQWCLLPAPAQKSPSLQPDETDPGASPSRPTTSHPSFLTKQHQIIWKKEANTPTLPFQPC